MDIVTQGLLGAAVAQSAAPREDVRRAGVIGFVSGLLADADILIQSTEDPLLNLDFHRHFTHSLVFIPLGGLIGAILLFPFFRKKLSFKKLYFYSCMGYLLSGLLDACTSYGTHLFWPFVADRVALNLISVVDPIFSGVLLLAIIAVFYLKKGVFARYALVLCSAYLALSLFQQQRVLDETRRLAEVRGHQARQILAKPSFGNILLWRTIYMTAERIQVNAVRAGFGNTKIYPGESVPIYDADQASPRIPPSSVLARDIERFTKFSHGYIAVHPDVPDLLGDIRYSMLPNSAKPLWGITLDDSKPNQHAQFRSFRTLSTAERSHFLDLLIGAAPGRQPLSE